MNFSTSKVNDSPVDFEISRKLKIDSKYHYAFRKTEQRNGEPQQKRSKSEGEEEVSKKLPPAFLPSGKIKSEALKDVYTFLPLGLPPLVFDSGGYSIKMGLAIDSEPTVVPNAIMKVKSEKKRLFIGNQIEECRDLSGLYYLLPCERGYISKWEVQKPIWDYILNKGIAVEERCVIMTQPIFNFKTVQECIDEIFFEEYEIDLLYRANPTDLSRYQYTANVIQRDEPCLIVDSGFSFTHIVPYIEGKKYLEGVRRVNIGGKFLTNYLRDIISYRMYDVMEETYVINQVKEDCVFVSADVREDLRKARLPPDQNPISINYVLPDFNMIRRGYIQDKNKKDEIAENCQILRLNNERFTVPELLFHPKDIGITSVGLAEAIVHSIMACAEPMRPLLAKNIILSGGNTKIPGFRNRLEHDVRKFLPDRYSLNIYDTNEHNAATIYPWKGGKALAYDPRFKHLAVSRQEYEEHGSRITYERFNAFSSIPEDSPPKKLELTPMSYMDHMKKYNVFGREDEVLVLSEDKSIVVEEDPGEGPSHRPDKTVAAPSSEEEKSDSASSMTESDDDTAKSSEAPPSPKDKKKQDALSEECIGDVVLKDSDYEILMECVRSYV